MSDWTKLPRIRTYCLNTCWSRGCANEVRYIRDFCGLPMLVCFDDVQRIAGTNLNRREVGTIEITGEDFPFITMADFTDLYGVEKILDACWSNHLSSIFIDEIEENLFYNAN